MFNLRDTFYLIDKLRAKASSGNEKFNNIDSNFCFEHFINEFPIKYKIRNCNFDSSQEETVSIDFEQLPPYAKDFTQLFTAVQKNELMPIHFIENSMHINKFEQDLKIIITFIPLLKIIYLN